MTQTAASPQESASSVEQAVSVLASDRASSGSFSSTADSATSGSFSASSPQAPFPNTKAIEKAKHLPFTEEVYQIVVVLGPARLGGDVKAPPALADMDRRE
jgi:hypothetical protein